MLQGMCQTILTTSLYRLLSNPSKQVLQNLHDIRVSHKESRFLQRDAIFWSERDSLLFTVALQFGIR